MSPQKSGCTPMVAPSPTTLTGARSSQPSSQPPDTTDLQRPTTNHCGKVEFEHVDLGVQNVQNPAPVVCEDSATAAPDTNPMLVPLAASSSVVLTSANRTSAKLNALTVQPLSGLPPFRSCSGSSAVSSVLSTGMSERDESALTFSANEEAIMDAILGI